MCPQHDRPASHAIYLFKCLKSRESIIIPTPVRVVELCRCGVKKKKNSAYRRLHLFQECISRSLKRSWLQKQPGVCNTELTSQMLVSLKSPQHLYSLHTSCLWNFRVQSTKKKKSIYISSSTVNAHFVWYQLNSYSARSLDNRSRQMFCCSFCILQMSALY